MISPIFYGNVENNALKLINPDRFKSYLYTLNGQDVEVIVAKRGKRRTDRQNKFYWGVVVKLISDYTGIEPNELHEFLKAQFAPRVETKIELQNGQSIVKLLPISTTKLFTKQFSDDYIEKIRTWAASDLNLVIPDPISVEVN